MKTKKKAKPVTAWMVKCPNGELAFDCIRRTKKELDIDGFCLLKPYGYRIVRVRIEEI